MLDVRSVEKTFGRRQAVGGVSFTVAPGEVVALLGANGAGKSTTLRMIAGALEPDRGEVFISGHCMITRRLKAQTCLGYLPEGAPLYAEMTAREFLAFMAGARGISGAARRVATDRAIADSRIGEILDQRISGLSKGYRRRVALAGAILHDPPVLLLDEPTDGLDPLQKQAVRSLIARMSPDRAILISTHTLSDVPAMCQRALLISRGRLVADETPAELAARADDGSLETAFALLTSNTQEPGTT